MNNTDDPSMVPNPNPEVSPSLSGPPPLPAFHPPVVASGVGGRPGSDCRSEPAEANAPIRGLLNTVEATLRGGKVVDLKVTPESRRKDVILRPDFI